MILYSRFNIDNRTIMEEHPTTLQHMVEDKLFQSLKPKVTSKMNISEEASPMSDSTSYSGEVAVLSKEEYNKLVDVKRKYYNLIGGNIDG